MIPLCSHFGTGCRYLNIVITMLFVMLPMFSDCSNNDNKSAEKSKKKYKRLAFHNQIYKIQFGEHTINFIVVLELIVWSLGFFKSQGIVSSLCGYKRFCRILTNFSHSRTAFYSLKKFIKFLWIIPFPLQIISYLVPSNDLQIT